MIRAKKSLGQHFMKCDWVTQTMIQASGVSSSDTVIEIGPGAGALTRPLARAAGHVWAIEKDEALARGLKNSLAKEGIKNVTIRTGDILKIQKSEIPDIEKSKVIANIPYYLTSHLFRYFLEVPPRPAMLIFTVQKEVGERVAAQAPHMNLLSLSIQVFADAKRIKKVPAECFSPRPKVDSVILSISNISDARFRDSGVLPERLFAIAREAFSKKRKMLSSSLKKFAPKARIEEILMSLGKSKNARPQELGPDDWIQFVEKL